MAAADPDEQRQAQLEMWERAAPAWGRRAGRVRELGMPVSARMIERLDLQPGQTVLELAAGPGDTGFLAAELVRPGGRLICSDGTEAMLEVARARATELGIDNVSFQRLQLEWIDLPTASVDAVLCRWGVMLALDPGAALQEMRRVLQPGGRVALAVWAARERNPWATLGTDVLVERKLAERPDPDAPGMFALAAPERLGELLHGAGFCEVAVEEVAFERVHSSPEVFLEESLDMSPSLGPLLAKLSEGDRGEVRAALLHAASAFADPSGTVRLPAVSLVASASS
jgi:SAM-dependent methyltransferase